VLLQASDGAAEDAFQNLRNAFGGGIQKQKMDALGASIHDFDYEAALAILDEIAELCAKTWTSPK
jgi:hypothetical protein